MDPQAKLSITLAVQEETRRCMAGRGFRYNYDANQITNEIMHSSTLGNAASGSVVAGFPSVEGSGGYGLYAQFTANPKLLSPPSIRPGQDGGDAAPSPDPNTAGMSKAEAARYEEALSGVSPTTAHLPKSFGLVGGFRYGGCHGKALADVWIKPAESVYLTMIRDKAGAELAAAVKSDSNFKAALAEWHACMTKDGFDFGTPFDAYNAVRSRYLSDGGATAPAHTYELSVAHQDKACRASSGLVAARKGAVDRAARQFVLKWETLLLKIRHDYQEAAARAKVILAGGTPSSRPTATASL